MDSALVSDANSTWVSPSWDAIFRDNFQRVFRQALRLTGNRADAEDLTQDVFVRVYNSLASFRPGSIEGWLSRITMNLFLDQVRRKSRIRFYALPENVEERLASSAESETPQGGFEHNNLDWDVADALAGLPKYQRVAVVLRDVEDLSYEEISETLGWKLGTVRSRIHRGRATLRATLAHRENGVGEASRGGLYPGVTGRH